MDSQLRGLGGEGIVVAVEMGWIRSFCLDAHLSCPLFRIQLKSVNLAFDIRSALVHTPETITGDFRWFFIGASH